MGVLELRMCDSDREKYGGQEWIRLDVDQVLDTPSSTLRRWELQTAYPIERAINEASHSMPATATQVLVWLARKQSGDHRSNPSGQAEPFSNLDDLKTMRVALRVAVDEAEDDVVPPDPSEPPETTPEP